MLKKLLLALLPGLLLSLGWAGIGITPLLFIAFIPLFILEDKLPAHTPGPWIGYSFVSMFWWWLAGTWWLGLENIWALISVVLLGSLLFTLVLMFFRFIKSKLGPQRGFLALPFLWIVAESLLLKAELNFPWLTLGNGLSNRVEIIQWYEQLGALGGSLWIWLVNLSVYSVYRSYQKNELRTRLGIRLILGLAVILVTPIWISLSRYYNYEPEGASVKVAVVQPGAENSFDQFVQFPLQETGDIPQLLVGPEALITEPVNLDGPEQNHQVQQLQELADQNPGMAILAGAITQKFYNGEYSSTAGQDGSGRWNDIFNSALFFQSQKPVQVYHKSRLVPGYEKLPFPSITEPLARDWLRSQGLKNRGYGTQGHPEVFQSGEIRVAPLICWEADFGEYVTYFTRSGANIFGVLSNDYWAQNSLSREQHLHYARLRAIENRRAIARSATSGISALIDQKGDVVKRIESGEIAVISAHLHTNDQLTYYSRAGNLVARLSYFLAGFLILFALVRGYLVRQETKV